LFSQTQEQNDQLLHDLLEQETGSPLNIMFPPSGDPDEGDHYLQMLEPSKNTQGGIGGEWLGLPLFDILEDAALPFVGWDSQQQFGESGLDHGLGDAQVDLQPISAGSVDPETMYNVIRQYLEDKNEIGQVTGLPPDEASWKSKETPALDRTQTRLKRRTASKSYEDEPEAGMLKREKQLHMSHAAVLLRLVWAKDLLEIWGSNHGVRLVFR
jgi:hypothetical protein